MTLVFPGYYPYESSCARTRPVLSPMPLASDWYQSRSGTLRHVNKGNIIRNFGAFWM